MTSASSSRVDVPPGAAFRQLLSPTAALTAAAFLVLYGPTAWSLQTTLWQQDAHSHGPIVLLVAIWLFLRGMAAPRAAGEPRRPRPILGALLIGLGLLVYVLGRSQAVYMLEVGSALPVVLGSIVLSHGFGLAKRVWFAFVFLLFLLPLPVSLIDTITQPMKIAVSWAVELLLYQLGYPVGRAGVILVVGPYQLFVADACAGLNSLFMLEAFGLLYLNVVRHESLMRNAVLAALIVPISFTSNVVRVVVLALVTYHFGDAAGQGFIHSFSGMVLFVVALLLTIAADAGVRGIGSRLRPRGSGTLAAKSAEPRRGTRPRRASAAPRLRPWHEAGLLAAAGVASTAAWALSPPPPAMGARFDLEAAIPPQFGEWKRVDLPVTTVDVVPQNQDGKSLNRPYDSAVLRAYTNRRGETVALAVAYASDQRQETKIHRPEVCYVAQGFALAEQSSAILLPGQGAAAVGLPGKRLYAQNARSNQVVSYWMRIGSAYPQSGWEFRKALFVDALHQRRSDGALVRASSQVASPSATAAGYSLNERFLNDLSAALEPQARRLLIGDLHVGANE